MQSLHPNLLISHQHQVHFTFHSRSSHLVDCAPPPRRMMHSRLRMLRRRRMLYSRLRMLSSHVLHVFPPSSCNLTGSAVADTYLGSFLADTHLHQAGGWGEKLHVPGACSWHVCSGPYTTMVLACVGGESLAGVGSGCWQVAHPASSCPIWARSYQTACFD
jgi:hypothetical protein